MIDQHSDHRREALDILSSMIRNVAVFCASANGFHSAYRAAAEDLGRALAARNIGVIYGGANVGLMEAVAGAALSAEGKVIGVIPEVLVDLEVAHRGITELHITSTMHTRKALIGEKADAFIALPGGFGTFEELFEVLAWHTLKLHAKPILLLNTHGFYDRLLTFLDHCVTEGMLKPKNRQLLLVAQTVEEALTMLQLDDQRASADKFG
ncbi:TIGR00730 family Rossman fold protein [Tunturibacter empetritectus]